MTEKKKPIYNFTSWAYTWYFDAQSEAVANFYNGPGSSYKKFHEKLVSWTDESGHEALRYAHGDYTFRMFSDPENLIKFTIGQVERCPTTYRLHFQGLIVFKKQVSKKFFKEHIPMPTVHFEPCHHDIKANINYTTKEKSRVCDFNSYGVPPPGQGARTDLVAVYEIALQEATAKEMLRELGAVGMRHINLYQKTVRVLQGDDHDDDQILARRIARKTKGSKAFAKSLVEQGFKVGGAYDSDDESVDEEEEAYEPIPFDLDP